MSRTSGIGRAWRHRAARLGLIIGGARLAAAQPAALANLKTVEVGQIRAAAEPRDLDLAIALAEQADRPADWYRLGRRSLGPLLLIVVRGQSGFDSMSRGRVPSWGAGLTLPAARFIVIRADGDDPFRVLRHELAHVALHQSIRGRVPLWFDEGYAVIAAGEFGRFEGLALNLTVARGKIPNLEQLTAGLRGNQSTAETAYALAGTAVTFLERRIPARSLEPLIARLATGIPFDSAVILTTGLSADRFDEAWRKEIKRSYGVGLWLLAGGAWVVVAALLGVGYFVRRRRDRPRREALDRGWDVPNGDAMDRTQIQPPENGDKA